MSYDDGDCRQYDMATRDYQVLSVRPKAGSEEEGQREGAAAPPSQKAEEATEGSLRLYAHRPSTSNSYGVSCFLIDNINLFGSLGGFAALTDRLMSALDPGGSLPSIGCIRQYLNIVHSLRARLETDAMEELVFALKETLPSLLLALGKGRRSP